MRGGCKTYEVPAMQADKLLNQAAPTSGTKYEVLATSKNVRIISIAVKCTWTVQPDPLEVHVTIDGQALTFTVANPVSNTYYFASLDSPATANAYTLQAVDYLLWKQWLLEGRSIKVEAEITGGTVSNLWCRLKYQKF